MSNDLNQISRIPSCVGLDDGVSLKAWIADLNQRASARDGVSDDSFTEADFHYARTQPWGSALNRFGDFAAFRARMAAFIEQERSSDACQRAACKGSVWEGKDGGWTCVDPLKPPPPRRIPPKRTAPTQPAPAKPKSALDISELKIPEKPWWSEQTPSPQTPQEPEVIASLTPDSFRIKDDSLQGLIDRMYDAKGMTKSLVDMVVETAKLQAGAGGIAGKEFDIVFAIDHSESMEPAASLARGGVDHILTTLTKEGAKEVRFGVVLFCDENEITVMSPLTKMTPETRERLIGQLRNLHFRGGREPVGLATQAALSLLRNQGGLGQVVVLTDMDGLAADKTYTVAFHKVQEEAQREGIAANLFNLNHPIYNPPPPKPTPHAKAAAVVGSIVPQLRVLIDPIGTFEKFYAPGNIPNGSYEGNRERP